MVAKVIYIPRRFAWDISASRICEKQQLGLGEKIFFDFTSLIKITCAGADINPTAIPQIILNFENKMKHFFILISDSTHRPTKIIMWLSAKAIEDHPAMRGATDSNKAFFRP